jgi:hypothetical protein
MRGSGLLSSPPSRFFVRAADRAGATRRGASGGSAARSREGPGCPAAARLRPSPTVQLCRRPMRSSATLSSAHRRPHRTRHRGRGDLAAPPRTLVVVSRDGVPRAGRRRPMGRKRVKIGLRANNVRSSATLARGSGRAETLRTIIELLREHSRVALARGLGYCAGARRPSSTNSTRSRSPG